jgi:hypothetical protein
LKDETNLFIPEAGTTILVQAAKVDAIDKHFTGSWLIEPGAQAK